MIARPRSRWTAAARCARSSPNAALSRSEACCRSAATSSQSSPLPYAAPTRRRSPGARSCRSGEAPALARRRPHREGAPHPARPRRRRCRWPRRRGRLRCRRSSRTAAAMSGRSGPSNRCGPPACWAREADALVHARPPSGSGPAGPRSRPGWRRPLSRSRPGPRTGCARAVTCRTSAAPWRPCRRPARRPDPMRERRSRGSAAPCGPRGRCRGRPRPPSAAPATRQPPTRSNPARRVSAQDLAPDRDTRSDRSSAGTGRRRTAAAPGPREAQPAGVHDDVLPRPLQRL